MSRPPQPRDPLFDLEYHDRYFRRHIEKDPHSDCVLWTGPRHRQGYGWIGAWRLDGSKIMTTTHRIVARMKYQQSLSPSQMVLHTCHRPDCVNPDHIVLGTRSDMQRLRWQKHGQKKAQA